MVKYLYNTTQSDKSYIGKNVAAGEYYLIPAILEVPFANNSQLLTDIATGDVIVSKSEDVSGHITDISQAIDCLKGNLPAVVESTNSPFASKTLLDGSKIYRRVRGVSGSVQGTTDYIDFTIPFTKCKITGVQILNGKIGDKANFKVLDSATGTITGIPNYELNEFGHDVYIIPDVATYPSKYDADLIYGLVLRIEYDPIDELLPRTIYVNLDLHEVVST